MSTDTGVPKISRVFYRIIYGDTDCGGVTYYAHYLRLFEIGRTELFRASGLTYREVEEKYALVLPVVEVYVRYRAPAHYDDLVEIETRISQLNSYKVRFDYRIFRDKKLLVEGFTLHVPVAKKTGKLTKFPAYILQGLNSLYQYSKPEG